MRNLSLLVLCVALFSASAWAQSSRREIRDAIHKLKSPNPEEVLTSVQMLGASGSKDAVGPLIDLLRTGPRSDVTNAAVQALGTLGQEKVVPILVEYMGHRRPDARMAAIFALENFEGKQVTAALEDALRDSDKQVRATAALSLGKRGSSESVPILFQAFDRGVWEAAIAVGRIGGPDDAVKLAEYLGKVDVTRLLPGFDEFLRRPDVSDKAKLAILDRLFELAGPAVKTFAAAYKASFPDGTEEDENPLYKKVSRMVRQIQED